MRRETALQKIAKRIDALQPRERLLLFVTVVVVLFVLWDSLLLRDQLAGRERLNQEFAAAETQHVAETARQDMLRKQLSEDPNERERARLARYQAEIARIDEVLKEKTLEFISPRQMVGALKSLIEKEPGLQLVSLETTGPDVPSVEAVADAAEAAGAANGGSEDNDAKAALTTPMVYLHGLEMEFEGDYFSVLNYVRRLESLKWRFGWSSLAIRMEDYPVSKVRIRLETLSLTEGWIGV
jgi:MSHA biogenesis protein MshJ